MAQPAVAKDTELYIEAGFWRLRLSEHGTPNRPQTASVRPLWIGPATGPERLTRKEAEDIAAGSFTFGTSQKPTSQGAITVVAFLKDVFVPEHVVNKTLTGRTHYHAMLNHIVTPEAVSEIFGAEAMQVNTRLEAVPGWPYLDGLTLAEVAPQNVEDLVSAALEHGYSSNTARHIRNVVHAVFALAKKKDLVRSDNPASDILVPKKTQEKPAVTVEEISRILAQLPYPAKEIAIVALLTGMNIAEICGLQWRFVNVTDRDIAVEDRTVPAKTIAVRTQLSGGAITAVTARVRARNVPIPAALLTVLEGLRERPFHTSPTDFVFASETGHFVNAKHLAVQRLRPLAQRMNMPSLSWRTFYQAHKTLAHELGMRSLSSSL